MSVKDRKKSSLVTTGYSIFFKRYSPCKAYRRHFNERRTRYYCQQCAIQIWCTSTNLYSFQRRETITWSISDKYWKCFRMREVTLKLKKCSFFVYLDHVIRQRGRKKSEGTAAFVRKLKDPHYSYETEILLGPLQCIMPILLSFPRVAAPLNIKGQKDRPFSFPSLTSTEKEAVQNLKMLLTSPPLLSHPCV